MVCFFKLKNTNKEKLVLWGWEESEWLNSFRFTHEATRHKRIWNSSRRFILHPSQWPYLPKSDFLCSPLFFQPTVSAMLYLYTVHLQRLKYSMLFSVTYESYKVLMRAYSSFTSHAFFLAVACISLPPPLFPPNNLVLENTTMKCNFQ